MTEQTRSQRLTAAGFTRRRTGKSAGGLMRDPEDDSMTTKEEHLRAEIKRLREQRAALLKALINLERTAGHPSASDDPVRVRARAAIAKATA